MLNLLEGRDRGVFCLHFSSQGLSKILGTLGSSRSLKWIKIGRVLILTHLLFVDDVLLFRHGSILEEDRIKETI